MCEMRISNFSISSERTRYSLIFFYFYMRNSSIKDSKLIQNENELRTKAQTNLYTASVYNGSTIDSFELEQQLVD